MSQRSITSFFTRLTPGEKKNETKDCKKITSPTEVKKRVRGEELSGSDSDAKSAETKKVLVSDKKLEVDKKSPKTKSTEPKKKRRKIIVASDSSSEEENVNTSPTKDNTSPKSIPLRKSAPRTTPRGTELKLEIAKILQEAAGKENVLKTENISEDSANTKNGKENTEANIKQENAEENIKLDTETNSKETKEEVKSEDVEIKQQNATKEEDESPKKKIDKKETKSTDSKDKKGDKVDSKDYNPAKSKYHPIDDACWKYGEKVPYMALARTLDEIEKVSARLRMIEILSNYFRSVIILSPDCLLPSVYLCLNKLAPAYEGVELGLADTYLMKAIAQSTGRTVAQIKSDAQSTGDLGLVAERSKSNQRTLFSFQPARLNIKSVFDKLREIASMTGHASMNKKVEKIQSMFVACQHCEARFLIRSLAGKLRVGLAEQSVLQALAQACATTPPNQPYPPKVINTSTGISAETFKSRIDEETLILKTTYCECPNYDRIIPVILKSGIQNLPNECKLTAGIPLKPMLAHPTKGVSEVLTRFEGLEFTCEWKYDGERAQIHMQENGKISIYSRNQEDNTSKYPDIIKRISNCHSENVKSFILDCEAVGWDRERAQILPFQILSTRKRKDANEADIKVQVCVFMFDLLYLNGESLVKKSLKERRTLLHEHFTENGDEWRFAKAIDANSSIIEKVQEFLEESVKGNCEGLMIKTLEHDATYEIAKRSRNWLKLKKDYLDGVGDTLDLVVLGGYLGKGKRTGTYGGFLLGCYDPDNEEYQTICKIGTGFSDEDLQTHSSFLKGHVIDGPRPYYRYENSLEPDHWFDPVQVWEVKCADLSLSPIHRAAIGIVDPEKGISLRFPRFVRIREDKSVEQATSAQQVADMYSNQDQIKNQQTTGAIEEDFY